METSLKRPLVDVELAKEAAINELTPIPPEISGGVEANSRFHIVFYEEMEIYRQDRILFFGMVESETQSWDLGIHKTSGTLEDLRHP